MSIMQRCWGHPARRHSFISKSLLACTQGSTKLMVEPDRKRNDRETDSIQQVYRLGLKLKSPWMRFWHDSILQDVMTRLH